MRLLEYSDHGYDAANRVTTITSVIRFGKSIYQLGTDSYVYNADGLVTSEWILGNQVAVSLTYDADNELTNVKGSELGNSVNVTYSYDSAGNRNSTGYGTTTGNEQTSSPGASYTYDNDGNLASEVTSSGTTTFTYDFRNRLTEVTVNGTVVATYTYDALNRRIGIDDGGSQTWTVYDGMNAYADFNGSGTLTERYLYGPAVDEILARTSSSGTTAWYLTDKEGSVNGIYESGTTLSDTIVYDSFGQVLTETNVSAGDRFKYAGMEYDAAIAIYYDQARDYNPVTGRFLQQDPLGLAAGDVNVYRYVGNDPVNLVDPNGLRPPIDEPYSVSDPPTSTPSQQSGTNDCCCCCCTGGEPLQTSSPSTSEPSPHQTPSNTTDQDRPPSQPPTGGPSSQPTTPAGQGPGPSQPQPEPEPLSSDRPLTWMGGDDFWSKYMFFATDPIARDDGSPSDGAIFRRGCVGLCQLRIGNKESGPLYTKGAAFFRTQQEALDYINQLKPEQKKLATIFAFQSTAPPKQPSTPGAPLKAMPDLAPMLATGLWNYATWHEPPGAKPYWEWMDRQPLRGQKYHVYHCGKLPDRHDATRPFITVYGVVINDLHNQARPSSKYDPGRVLVGNNWNSL